MCGALVVKKPQTILMLWRKNHNSSGRPLKTPPLSSSSTWQEAWTNRSVVRNQTEKLVVAKIERSSLTKN